MDRKLLDIFKTCLTIWALIYGTWIYSGNLFGYFLPSCLLIGTLLLGLFIFRVPPPETSRVKKIVGRDPCDEDDGSYFMKVIGHRGGGLDAPENTLAAFKNCADKGCDAVEFDLSMTKDNVPIIYHDPTLKRLADINGTIKAMTWDELADIDIAVKHPLRERFPNARIATFKDTIETCLSANIRMFIDIKETDQKIVQVIVDTFHERKELYEKAVVSGFNPLILYLIRRSDPKIVCSMAYRPYYFTYECFEGLAGYQTCRTSNIFKFMALFLVDFLWSIAYPFVGGSVIGISLILLHKDLINLDVVRQWRDRGIRVIAWTVNQPTEKQFFKKYLKVTYCTDTLIGELPYNNVSNNVSRS